MEQWQREGGRTKMVAAVGLFAARSPWKALFVVAAITLLLAPWLPRVGYDDNILRFLPQNSAALERFEIIAERFKGLSVALVGLEVEQGDLFTRQRLNSVKDLTEALRQVPGVAFATSISVLQDVDVSTDPQGVEQSVIAPLIDTLPANDQPFPDEHKVMQRLRERVLSRPHVLDSLISRDGKAAVIICYLASQETLQQDALQLRDITLVLLGDTNADIKAHFGGAPFVGSYIVDSTQRDTLRLSLLAALAIMTLVLLAVRSRVVAFVALLAVALSIVWTVGLMGLFGVSFSLVSSSLPMLFLALGSAYSLHLLVKILHEIDAQQGTRQQAVEAAVCHIAPPIFVAGLTSALAFLSFCVMDIEPMRQFGLWMFVGTLLVVLLSLLVVPAVCVLLPLRVRREGRAPRWFLSALVVAARFVARHRIISAGVLLLALATSVWQFDMGRTRMSMRDFFDEDSAPVRAENFLEHKLGGSVFIQIQISGDIKNPLVLQQIDRLSAFVQGYPGVTHVQSVVDPMLIAAHGLTGVRALPATQEATRTLVALIADDPHMALLVDPEWQHALVYVTVRAHAVGMAQTLVEQIHSRWQNQPFGARLAVRREHLSPALKRLELHGIAVHIADILNAAQGARPSVPVFEKLLIEHAESIPQPLSVDQIASVLKLHLEEEGLLLLRTGKALPLLAANSAASMARGEFSRAGFSAEMLQWVAPVELEDPDNIQAAVSDILHSLKGITAEEHVQKLIQFIAERTPSPLSEQVQQELWRALQWQNATVAMLPEDALAKGHPAIVSHAHAQIEVTGTPVIYAAMDASVRSNQIQSLILSLLLVFLTLTWFFRDVRLALVALVPAAMTVAVVFGLMGIMQIPLDVGTSMVTSIALGIGIDYAVHFLWCHGVPTPSAVLPRLQQTMQSCGWGIVLNAGEVAIGFSVLAMGVMVPMRHVGLLTAAAMLLSAMTTLVFMHGLVLWVVPNGRRNDP